MPLHPNSVYKTNQLTTMSPGQAVLALYDGVLRSMDDARQAMKDKSIPRKGEAISKALRILEALTNHLDHENGGDIAKQLESIYDFATTQLLHANLRTDPKYLDAAERPLRIIRDTWEEMLEKQAVVEAPEPRPEPVAAQPASAPTTTMRVAEYL